MSNLEMTKLRIDTIRKLKIKRDNAICILENATKNLAEYIVENLKYKYMTDDLKLFGKTDGILYHILDIKPIVELWGNNINAGVKIIVERFDKYTPTEVESKLLSKKPKDIDKLLSWLYDDHKIYEFKQLKNHIFRELYYHWDLNSDNIEKSIEKLNINLVPLAHK